MPYRFIFRTWLLIMPIQIIAIALAFALSDMFKYGAGNYASYFELNTLATIGALSFLFSIPGLFGLAMLVWIAKEFLYYPAARFTFICIGSAFITMLCYVLMDFILSFQLPIRMYFQFMVPSICTVLIALFLTRKGYFSYLNETSP
jgi:hypothetical protein